ncbi:trihelix transcription factor GTL1 isoform X2 [Elaeis guineensis]|uniref:Trihelix transcription factor GTL1 isoform X2 n=1 Tax=Elaeis guineensis var. tenera TaxID=51953 RepID=A0A6I9RX55_ELAGV|nr:trihelix transcription factor GTL1 isoform X2 [Elaeis guineensis]
MQQQGGSQYGVPPPPDLTPFSSPGAAPRAHMLGISSPDPLQQQPPQLAEAASPISSRPPPPGTAPRSLSTNFEELVPAVPGNFPDDEALAAAGEEVERGSAPGNRWPRQETLALLKIRSDMDAAFREATLKGPLWEDVSRRLAELGYRRSAKKCKEKFENVHKYYKRTKEGRAGRQDGKSYRFFSQLEALHSSSSTSAAAPSPTTTAPALPTAATAAASPTPIAPSGISTGMVGPSTGRIQPPPISSVAPPPITMPTRVGPELTPTTGATPPGISFSAAATAGISFSSDTSSSSASSESDDEETEEAGGSREGRKRKRVGGSGRSRKMRAFFEGLMKQVMERQEAMQQRFLEAIEKREQDRMIREEAWRRQEMARLNREHELLAQERAMAASRDAAIISYIQKISGQTVQLPTITAAPSITLAPPQQPSVTPPPASAPPPQQPQQPPSQQQQHQKSPSLMQPALQQQELHQHHQSTEIGRHQVSSSSELVLVPEPQETMSFETVSSSRWPKAEVHALIKMRSGLELKYQETGPKGPLWEEISAGMQRLGYNRSAKRCKEKWENINKYFKKVKESNKKRPEDSKTCPYFHQLDALYRKKLGGSGGGGRGGSSGFGIQQQESNPQERSDVPTIMAPPPAPPPQQPPAETESKKGNNNNNNNNDGNNNNNNRNGGNSECGGGSRAIQMQTSNGGLSPTFLEEGSSTKMKKKTL